jgi:hypothetical protein
MPGRPLMSFEASLDRIHNHRAPKQALQGVDFLRKSTLWRRGLGYIYCGFDIKVERLGYLQAIFAGVIKLN